MALRIGEIFFSVGADTTGLEQGMNRMRAFRQVVNQTAKLQSTAAQQTARALGNQEKEMAKAFATTTSLQEAIRRTGGAEKDLKPQIDAVSAAFNRLTKEMESGKLTQIQFQRSMATFNGKMADARAQLANFKVGHNGQGLVTWMRNLESASVLAVGPLSGIGARIRSIGAIAGRVKGPMLVLIGVVTGLAVAMGMLASSIMPTIAL